MAVLPKIVYNFNENDTSDIRDYSENGNDGAGKGLSIQNSSRVGKEVVFNAATDNLGLGNFTGLNGKADCAIHLGVSIGGGVGTLNLVKKRDIVSIQYNNATGQLECNLFVNSGTATVNATIANDVYFDIDLVYDSDVLTLYIDGVSTTVDNTQSGVIDTNTQNFNIGDDSGDGAVFLLNEFKLYDEAITTSLIGAVINQQNGIYTDVFKDSGFEVGDVIFTEVNDLTLYGVVSWVGTGTDFRFLPLTDGIYGSLEFRRGAHLWDTSRQWGLLIDDTPKICFYDLQTKSTEIFIDAKKTYCLTKEGVIKNSSTTTGTYQVLSSDQRIYVDSTSGAFTVILEASPTTNREIEIIDSVGNCNANTVTIGGAGNSIIGGSTYSMNTSYEALKLIFNGANWNLN